MKPILIAIALLFAFVGNTTSAAAFFVSWWGINCPADPTRVTDKTLQGELGVTIKDLSATGKFSYEEITKLLSMPHADIQRSREFLYAVCAAYETKAISREAYQAYARDWTRDIISRSNPEGPKIIFIDSVLNAYRKSLRNAGASNIDDILPGLAAQQNFMTDRFPVMSGENANAMWLKTPYVVRQKPDVTVIHFSAFEEGTNTCVADPGADTLCNTNLFGLVQQLLLSKETSKVIVYTRTDGICSKSGEDFRTNFRNRIGLPGEKASLAANVLLFEMSGNRTFKSPTVIAELAHVIEKAEANAMGEAVKVNIPGYSATGRRYVCPI
ncbi:hypothetical protein [Rhizobium laguerreae]|uniref:hypothetical protein n=1 Tax=Rhizobium laguerreae TaxID=1076926 RepID=UPI001C90CA43|nr:hypothetical protein [Rhizobium laguerreae]MBY3381687.1 hypothetical protein [Rhizobium laguerreae]